MPTIIDGITFYSEEEGRALAHAKIKKDAKRIAARYKKQDAITLK